VKIIGVIPARFGSTRFPGKPLALLGGKPIVQWVIEGAKKSQKLTSLLLATDDERIAAIATQLGVEAVMTDSNLPSGTDRIWAAISQKDCDVAINIQGDEPFVSAKWIDSLVQPFFTSPLLKMATLGHRFNSFEEMQSPHTVKVLMNEKDQAIYFSRYPIPFSKKYLFPVETAKEHLLSDYGLESGGFKSIREVLKHVGMYAFRKEFLGDFCKHPQPLMEKAESLEQLRALFMGVQIQVVEVENTVSIGIDTQEDLKRAEAHLKLI
jgi:3-deoxy-manno-octulosonate cytidylyltransferase (CMP-KDO synthetase)